MIKILQIDNYTSLQELPLAMLENFPAVKGKRVFIKPNLVMPTHLWDNCSTTNVEVVEMIIKKCLQEEAREIIVGDCGFKDQWEATMGSTGYDQLEYLDSKIQLIPLQNGENYHKFTLKRLDRYRSLFGAKLSDHLLSSEVIINVPKMKVHCMAIVTGAIKNMMGTMLAKGSMHPRANIEILHERLADLYQLTQPLIDYIVMDGIVGAEYAEQYGHPVKSRVLILGTDQWEVDVSACKLMGINPAKVPYLRYIRQDFHSVTVPDELITEYELPLHWKDKL